MKKQTKSLLEELEILSRNRDTKHIIENRAINVIASAIHLIEVIYRNFDADTAAVLEKKIFVAIKNRDSSKFTNSLKKQDNQNENKRDMQ